VRFPQVLEFFFNIKACSARLRSGAAPAQNKCGGDKTKVF